MKPRKVDWSDARPPDGTTTMANMFSNILGALKNNSKIKSSHDPRTLIEFSDIYILKHFERLGYSVSYDQLVFTIETITDFLEARQDAWHKPGTIIRREIPGLLVVEDAQPRPDQPTRDVVVVSLGGARVVMGAINRSKRIPARYAIRM